MRLEKPTLGAGFPKRMTQVGRNWNQLVYEMNGWLVLGRELETVTNSNENAVL